MKEEGTQTPSTTYFKNASISSSNDTTSCTLTPLTPNSRSITLKRAFREVRNIDLCSYPSTPNDSQVLIQSHKIRSICRFSVLLTGMVHRILHLRTDCSVFFAYRVHSCCDLLLQCFLLFRFRRRSYEKNRPEASNKRERGRIMNVGSSDGRSSAPAPDWPKLLLQTRLHARNFSCCFSSVIIFLLPLCLFFGKPSASIYYSLLLTEGTNC